MNHDQAKKSARVKSLAFHSVHSWLAIAFYDGKVQLYDYQQERILYEYQHHSGPVRAVDLIDDCIVSGGDDGKILLCKNYQWAATLHGHTDYIRSLKFQSPRLLVSAGDDQTIRLWDCQERICLGFLQGEHSHAIMSLAVQEALLVSASSDQTIIQWNLERVVEHMDTGGLLSENQDLSNHVTVMSRVKGHAGGVNAVAIHPTQTPLDVASAGDDGRVKLWRGGGTESTTLPTSHTQAVSGCVFLPNDNSLISCGEDGCLC